MLYRGSRGDKMDYKILICDDEKEILELIELYLGKEGYSVVKASDGQEAIEKVKNDTNFDLAIVDIMMPRVDGYKVIKEIRKLYNIPIIMLSAKNQDSDKILGLDLGADDYITKPFNLDVLLLRIKKLINLDSDNELELVKEQRAVRKNGRLIELTKKEYLILEYFFSNPNIILTRDQILNKVWGIDYFGDDRVVDTNIKRIRRKIDENKKYIKTASGTGYIFVK